MGFNTTKKEEKKGLKVEKTPKEKEIYATIVILLLILVIGYFHYTDKIDEHNSCVNACTSEHDSCVMYISNFAQSGTEYILYDDYQSCFDDLDMCMSDCED